MKQKTRPASGFSIIEVLFAMLFLSIVVFGVIKLQTSNLTLANTKQNELRAHFIAAQGLQIVDALGKATLTSCNGGSSPCYLTLPSDSYDLINSGPELLGDDLFDRTIEFEDAGLTDAYLVTAVVHWEDSAGDHEVSAKRVIFN